MQPGTPVGKTSYCPHCGTSIASYPRSEDTFHCYACDHNFDIDDIERCDRE